MALSEDQKAILRLLAQRGEQGYEDLAALMGIEVSEVHAKASEAAEQLESEGIPAPAIPPLPGASAVESPAPAPTEPPAEKEPARPEPAESPAAPPPSEPKPRRAPPPRPNVSLPSGGGARAALAAGILVVIALVLVLVLGGGEDSDDTSGGSTTASEQAVNSANGSGKEVTQAILDPVDGGDATGVATFGRIKNSLALQIEATGLEPTAKGESYTVWLYQSPQKMLPLASTRVDEQGKIGAQVEVPTEVLGYLANETFDQIDISLTSDATLKASLAKATREKKAPIYTGTDVLRGRITGPIIGAAKK